MWQTAQPLRTLEKSAFTSFVRSTAKGSFLGFWWHTHHTLLSCVTPLVSYFLLCHSPQLWTVPSTKRIFNKSLLNEWMNATQVPSLCVSVYVCVYLATAHCFTYPRHITSKWQGRVRKRIVLCDPMLFTLYPLSLLSNLKSGILETWCILTRKFYGLSKEMSRLSPWP